MRKQNTELAKIIAEKRDNIYKKEVDPEKFIKSLNQEEVTEVILYLIVQNSNENLSYDPEVIDLSFYGLHHMISGGPYSDSLLCINSHKGFRQGEILEKIKFTINSLCEEALTSNEENIIRELIFSFRDIPRNLLNPKLLKQIVSNKGFDEQTHNMAIEQLVHSDRDINALSREDWLDFAKTGDSYFVLCAMKVLVKGNYFPDAFGCIKHLSDWWENKKIRSDKETKEQTIFRKDFFTPISEIFECLHYLQSDKLSIVVPSLKSQPSKSISGVDFIKKSMKSWKPSVKKGFISLVKRYLFDFDMPADKIPEWFSQKRISRKIEIWKKEESDRIFEIIRAANE